MKQLCGLPGEKQVLFPFSSQLLSLNVELCGLFAFWTAIRTNFIQHHTLVLLMFFPCQDISYFSTFLHLVPFLFVFFLQICCGCAGREYPWDRSSRKLRALSLRGGYDIDYWKFTWLWLWTEVQALLNIIQSSHPLSRSLSLSCLFLSLHDMLKSFKRCTSRVATLRFMFASVYHSSHWFQISQNWGSSTSLRHHTIQKVAEIAPTSTPWRWSLALGNVFCFHFKTCKSVLVRTCAYMYNYIYIYIRYLHIFLDVCTWYK